MQRGGAAVSARRPGSGVQAVIWNECYRVPSPSSDDVCDYPLARNLVMLTVAVACRVPL